VEGWGTKRLDEIGAIVSGSTPSTSKPAFWDGDIVWVTPNDLSKLNTPYLRDSAKRITHAGLSACSTHLLPPGSLVLSSRAPIGYVALPTVSFCTNQGCKTIRLKNDFHAEFTYYNILFNMQKIKNLGEGTTFAEISKTALSTVELFFPSSKTEQAKIAEILSTVDRAIEQTEALIAKQQRIKTGLMQDLLTRGIDEHGNVRSEKTHKFKDSPLGRIPVEWTEQTLSEVYAEIPRNGIFKTVRQIGTGALMIGQTSFTSNRRINYRLGRRAEVSTNELLLYGLRENDILITRVYATVDGVGQPVLVDACPEPTVYESNMLRLRLNADKALPTYTFYWLLSAPIRTFVVAAVNASNQTSVNQKVLGRIPIHLPTKPEQEAIVGVLTRSEKSIETNEICNVKLSLYKTALMQDLLPGKKRVTALLAKEAPTL